MPLSYSASATAQYLAATIYFEPDEFKNCSVGQLHVGAPLLGEKDSEKRGQWTGRCVPRSTKKDDPCCSPPFLRGPLQSPEDIERGKVLIDAFRAQLKAKKAAQKAAAKASNDTPPKKTATRRPKTSPEKGKTPVRKSQTSLGKGKGKAPATATGGTSKAGARSKTNATELQADLFAVTSAASPENYAEGSREYEHVDCTSADDTPELDEFDPADYVVDPDDCGEISVVAWTDRAMDPLQRTLGLRSMSHFTFGNFPFAKVINAVVEPTNNTPATIYERFSTTSGIWTTDNVLETRKLTSNILLLRASGMTNGDCPGIESWLGRACAADNGPTSSAAAGSSSIAGPSSAVAGPSSAVAGPSSATPASSKRRRSIANEGGRKQKRVKYTRDLLPNEVVLVPASDDVIDISDDDEDEDDEYDELYEYED
ncbi:hypothetical protein R3P38DRAFT_2808920 [Favolaschia claudopus]|uniref:Uncharacterized protein n=1 Tax=Favolaschia claudopus TaxID=2862362 RepID=A0AAV9ZFP7_9AGAR